MVIQCVSEAGMSLVVISAPGLVVLIADISIQEKANGEKQVGGNLTLQTGPWQSSGKPPPGLHVLINVHHGLNLVSYQYSV